MSKKKPMTMQAQVAPESQADMSFEDFLQLHVTAPKGLGEEDRNIILHVLSMPKTGILGMRRKNMLARMERRARTELGVGPTEAIDWSKVNWAEIFGALIQFLMKFFFV